MQAGRPPNPPWPELISRFARVIRLGEAQRLIQDDRPFHRRDNHGTTELLLTNDVMFFSTLEQGVFLLGGLLHWYFQVR